MNNSNSTNKFSSLFSVINLCLIIAVVISSVAYFITVNSLSVKGFELRDLKLSHDSLLFAKQDMESRMVDLASTRNLNQRLSQLRLVPTSHINYLSDSVLLAQR
ncbi:MAG: hypothetical protein QY321_02620 [Patescibacteria group bacterium]|nr:MAG: hypothetical protein QY321_02620 [Patescibacteria group bacterium]